MALLARSEASDGFAGRLPRGRPAGPGKGQGSAFSPLSPGAGPGASGPARKRNEPTRLKITPCLLGLPAALAFSLPAAAQDSQPDSSASPDAVAVADQPVAGDPAVKPRATDDAEAVARLTLALQPAEHGRKSKSPLALAAAAELLAATGVKDADLPKTAEGAESPVAGAEPAQAPAIGAEALYTEAAAAARAASDESLAEAIE
ncbi:MAG: hypothetical protein LBW85_05640 [Deltaproteobacteria bacterium]|jgi:hypothetical protein|nr:hypothetical protein [Deltaproteobacteria bacterium]